MHRTNIEKNDGAHLQGTHALVEWRRHPAYRIDALCPI
jgi:hypothetical protein